MLRQVIAPDTGKKSSQWTTATTQARSEDCCATTATQESDILVLSQWHLPPLGTSDFTLGQIVSIEPDGVEEVFDVQVTDTENFIANGLVTHNTWWNDDDWAGRIQQSMATESGDMFEIVKYPAINDLGDEYILPDDSMVQLPEGSSIPEGAVLTRVKGTALHPERYTVESLLKRKASYYALGQQRWWSALYQQNPSPEEGAYFTKKMFKTYDGDMQTRNKNIYQAWDFAITTGTANDWTVGCTIMQDEHDNLYVLDVNRFRSDDGIDIVDTMVEYARTWNVGLIGVEDGQIWKSLATTFTKTCEAKGYYPAYEVLKPLTDKLVRAQPLRGRMQANKLYWPARATWYENLKTEFLRFPAGTHDDQIDSLAWAIRLTLSKSAPKPPAQKELKSWKDKLSAYTENSGGGHMSA
jgi:predicted phage terminase large subunit-like protein